MNEWGETVKIRHIGSGWVPAGGGHLLPRSYVATIESAEHDGFVIELVVDVDNFARTSCRELRFRATGDTPVTAPLLRAARLPVLLALSARAAVEKVKRNEDGSLRQASLTQADVFAFFEEFRGSRMPRQGSPLTDGQLRKIAEIYRGAVAVGLPPVKAIQEAEHVSRATASRWVARAREHGFLEKSSDDTKEV